MRKEDLELQIKSLNEEILKEKDSSLRSLKTKKLQKMVETLLSMKRQKKETKEAVSE